MAVSSSTSSSDAAAPPSHVAPSPHGPRQHAPLGFPWALLLAILIIAGVEVWLRSRDPLSLIAYATDEGQYHAVRDTVAAEGAAEVALVGSSQVREGVVMPTLIAELSKKIGRPVRVSNYAVRGARLDVMAAEVRFLQRQAKPPALIVVGVSPRDLRAEDEDWPRVALFWNFADWWHALRRDGWEVTDVLPVVIRNEASRALATLQYREEITLTIARKSGLDAPEEPNPILGQGTFQHEGSRGERSLTSVLDPNRRPRIFIKQLYERVKSTYLFDLPAKPPRAMRTALTDTTQALAGGPAKGLIVQMPVADYLNAILVQDGQLKQFQAAVAADTKAAGVPYLPVEQQAFQPTNDHFVDLQHLNRPGADAFAVWLAGEIAGRLQH